MFQTCMVEVIDVTWAEGLGQSSREALRPTYQTIPLWGTYTN